jgi:hypothetical protein
MRVPPLVVVLFGSCLVAAGAPALADSVNFTARLAIDDPSAPQASEAKGSAALTLDTATRTLAWTVEYSGLSHPADALRCGSLEARTGPAIVAAGELKSPITGSKALSGADIAALSAGRWVCVVSAGDQTPELGGQVKPVR